MNAAKEAKLPKKTRNNLQTLAETAQAKLAALDKFTGKDLAAAMGKQGEMVDWKEGNATAQAFKEAQSAQQDLSRAIADALGKIKDGNAQAVMEELMLQCDRRIGELDTLALQIADIIDKGGENTESKAASLAGSGTISSYTSANALDKFGRENRFTTWEHRRIGNDQIRRVIVRNMNLSGKDSEIMVAQVCNQARTKRGYCFLMPDYLNLNTQELGALMDTLMQLHLLRIVKSLSWLRRAYSQ